MQTPSVNCRVSVVSLPLRFAGSEPLNSWFEVRPFSSLYPYCIVIKKRKVLFRFAMLPSTSLLSRSWPVLFSLTNLTVTVSKALSVSSSVVRSSSAFGSYAPDFSVPSFRV